MQNNSQIQGREGEAEAKKYLINNGYTILESNWRFKKLEVDLIASNHNVIAFVEVKTRKNNAFGEPEVFVDKQKQKFLITAAQHYLVANNIQLEARFDIIAIILHNNNKTVKHLPGAFYPKIK